MFCSSNKRKIQALCNQITGLICSSLFILLKGRVASMRPNQNFRRLSNEWSMIKDNYSKVRSSSQPKNERKILGAICITQKSRRKAFTELGKVSLKLPRGRIDNCRIMQQMYTHIWGLGLLEKWGSTVRAVSRNVLPDPQESENNVHHSCAHELYRIPKGSKVSDILNTHHTGGLCRCIKTSMPSVCWIYYKWAK